MNDNATIQTPEELKAQAQTMLEQAREMEREAQRKIQEQKDEQKRRERIAAEIGTIQSFGPKVLEVYEAIRKTLGVEGKAVKPYGEDEAVTRAAADFGALAYSFSYGRMSFSLHYNPTVFRGSAWHGRYESVGVIGVRIEGFDGDRHVNRLIRCSKWEGAADKLAKKIAEVKDSEDAHANATLAKAKAKTNTLDTIREAFASHPALLVKIEPVMRQTEAWRNRGPYVETGLYTVTVAMKGEGDAVIPIQTYYDVRVEKDGKVHGTVSRRVTVQEHIEKVVK